MDSDSAPALTPQLSNSPGSNYASLPSQSSDNVNVPSVETHIFNTDNNKNTSLSGGVGDGGSENEGFLSGEADFESASDKPILGGEDISAPYLNYSEFWKLNSQRPVAKVSVDDDDHEIGGSRDGVLAVEAVDKVSVGGDRDLMNVGAENTQSLGTGGGILEQRKIFAETDLAKNANFGELAKENGVSDGHEGAVDVSRVVEDDKTFGSSKSDDGTGSVIKGSLMEEKELEGADMKKGKIVVEQETEAFDGRQSEVLNELKEAEVVGDSKILTGGSNEDNSVIAQPADNKLVVSDGANLTSGGDSVGEAVHIHLSQSGAAVVGDSEEVKEYEIGGIEVSVDRGVNLDNGFNKLRYDSEEPEFDRTVVAESGNEALPEPNNTITDSEKMLGKVDELKVESEVEKNGLVTETDGEEILSTEGLVGGGGAETSSRNCISDLAQHEPEHDAKPLDDSDIHVDSQVDELEAKVSGTSHTPESMEASSTLNNEIRLEAENVKKHLPDEEDGIDGSVTDEETEGIVFGSSESAQQFLEELEQGSGTGSHSGAESSRDHSQRIDGQIVTDSDEEVDTDEEGGGKELFDSAALAALLKAATGAGSDGGNITVTAQDGSRLFSVERPAGLGSSLRSVKPASRSNHSNLFAPSNLPVGGDSDNVLNEEEKRKLEKFQQIRVMYLRLIERLGLSTEESIARQVLYRLALVSGRQTSQAFSLETAKTTALQLEAEGGKDDLNFSLNILVLGKTGVGKSATINSIFGEEKTPIYAFGPATTTVKEIAGMVDGVKIRVFDTPGLKSAAMEQAANRRILSSVKRFTRKCPPDIVLYVDRLDTQSRDLNDLPLLKSITSALGPAIWRSVIVTLTHAASSPPDGPSGSPLNYELFVAQRTQIVQQAIGQAVGDLRLMNPGLMNPVSLVENHPSCRKNRDGQKVLPNGQTWKSQLLLLCYSMKILSEASSLSKPPQDAFDHRKLFGFRARSPPLPYLLSWLLQSRTHPKLSADQGGDNGDSDIDLEDLSDSDDEEEEDEYDQLPSFKPLKNSQIAKLNKEQRKAYFDEYEYRVKLLQKKQWREELKRMKEMKKKGKVSEDEYGYMGEEDPENGSPAAVPVALPDMVLPPSFDGDSPAYRYRFLEPTSHFLARPVLDTHGWDHDCGYDGVNLEHSLAIASRYPAAVNVQVTKDKKEFNIHLDSSVAAKYGENGSTMAGFDIQNIGKQLAYIVRGETKFKNFKKNKTSAGISVTFLGENVSTGVKIEDQIALGKRLVLVGSTGTVRSQGDSAYGANLEVRLREADYPVGQDQSSLGLSLVKWRGDLALGANFQSQFSIGRNYKLGVRAGLNNKLSGQISVKTSSSDQLQIALVAILPIVRAICKNVWPGGATENYSIY